MRRQRGQAAVEFAIIAPLFFMMCFGMIYAGILFMDYLQYNNAARSIARAVSVENPEVIDKSKYKAAYINPITTLYEIKEDSTDLYIGPPLDDSGNVIDANSNDVEVIIKLKLNADLPSILSAKYGIGFPPEELKPIKYVMSRETQL